MLGYGAALAATRVLTNLVYEVSSTDPLTFAMAAVLLLCVATAASLVPAWRASRIDPAASLRAE